MDLSRDLADELQAIRFGRYAKVRSSSVKEFEGYSMFHEVMDATVNLECDAPCRAGLAVMAACKLVISRGAFYQKTSVGAGSAKGLRTAVNSSSSRCFMVMLLKRVC